MPYIQCCCSNLDMAEEYEIKWGNIKRENEF